MPSSTFSYSFFDSEETGDPISTGPLSERLKAIVEDSASTAEKLVLETSAIVQAWIYERPEAWSFDEAGAEIEFELAPWIAEQAWRGPCALWIDSLRRAFHWARSVRPAAGLHAVLGEEVGLWSWGRESGFEHLGEDFKTAWKGEPLGSGRRLPARDKLAVHAASTVERGETILVSAFSETVALAIEEAQLSGKHPAVLISESLPDLDGRRMAQRLVKRGIPVTLLYDAALLNAVPRADHVWLSTEAIGAENFLARIGTQRLIEEADRHEVPVCMLATSDKLMPGGALRLPERYVRETWLLWDEAPEGVRLDSQAFEEVPLDRIGQLWTEIGEETVAELHLRSLRVEAAPSCTAGVLDAMHSIVPAARIEPAHPLATTRAPAPKTTPLRN